MPDGRLRQLRDDGQWRTKLTCATFLTHYLPGPDPGRAAEVFSGCARPDHRDDRLHGKLQSVKPWIIREEETAAPEGEYLQTPEQLDSYKQFSMCINCLLCYAACPVYGLDQHFIGPAAIALAQRYNKDSRDQGAQRAPG